MAKAQSKFSFTMGRLWHFIKLLLHKKKSAFGLAINAVFAIVAIWAPLFTPYSSLGEDPKQRFFPLGISSCAPSWLRHLPTWLGGNPDLSDNMVIIKNTGLPKIIDDEGGEWNVTKEGKGITIETREDENFWQAPPGFRDFAEQGSLSIKFTREKGTLYNESRIFIYHEFDFPYTGPAGRFIGNIGLLVRGTTNDSKLDVPIIVRVYLGHSGGKLWKLWPCPYIRGVSDPPIGFALDSQGQPW